jgi:hypothetical protein
MILRRGGGGCLPFKWPWKSAKGHSRGTLKGIKDDNFEIEDSEVGNFYVSMVLRNRITNLKWELITVYGPTQHDLSPDFITELPLLPP